MNRSKTLTPLFAPALALALVASTAGCNLFSFMDAPGNSDQYLSRARACFDAGDYECAQENYGKVSGDNLDQAKSEKAFAILAEEGIELGDFYSALTATSNNGGSGTAVNTLAETLSARSPGEAKRQAIFEAYILAASISDASTELRGLTRLVTSMSLIAEMLAEGSGTDGVVNRADLVSDEAACVTGATCATETGCGPNSSWIDTSTADTLTPDWDLEGTTDLTGTLTIQMLRSGLAKLNQSFTELGQAGGTTQDASDFAGQFEGIDATTGAAIYNQCYMQTLLDAGIGQ